jgi:hypothetical protein
MPLADQLVTLGAVGIGAAASYLATSFAERARHRRELSGRWEERRFEIYSAYITQAKELVGIARRLAGTRGLQDNEAPLSLEAGLPLLDAAEDRREALMEPMTLLAGPEMTLACRGLSTVLYRLKWFARGKIPEARPEEFALSMRDLEAALNKFHLCAREEIGVPAEYTPKELPREGDPVTWIRTVRAGEV